MTGAQHDIYRRISVLGIADQENSGSNEKLFQGIVFGTKTVEHEGPGIIPAGSRVIAYIPTLDEASSMKCTNQAVTKGRRLILGKRAYRPETENFWNYDAMLLVMRKVYVNPQGAAPDGNNELAQSAEIDSSLTNNGRAANGNLVGFLINNTEQKKLTSWEYSVFQFIEGFCETMIYVNKFTDKGVNVRVTKNDIDAGVLKNRVLVYDTLSKLNNPGYAAFRWADDANLKQTSQCLQRMIRGMATHLEAHTTWILGRAIHTGIPNHSYDLHIRPN